LAGLNPLTYLHECARASGTTPTDQALTRFLPWAAGTDDLTAWTNGRVRATGHRHSAREA
jgi:hypothetical protein